MKRRQFLKSAALGGAAATALAAPAVAQSRKEMIIVSTWGRDFPGLGISAQRLAERITELTEGRIVTQYFAAGERVGAFDVFDEVSSGNSQAYIGGDYYWTGKHPALAYFTAVPFGMTTPEWNAWIKYRGGQELWDELHGEFGMKALPAGSTGTQAGGWFNKEIETPADLEGLKMRIPGLGTAVMSKLGVATVSVPGGQIYESLVSGAIEATEWVGPYNDYFLKLYEAAEYYYTAGMHEPGGGLSLAMNLDFWGSLSELDRQIITAASHEEHAAQYEEALANNGTYLKRLVDEHGVKIRSFSDEVWDAFGEAAMEVFEETRDHSPLAKKIDDSFQASLREVGGYMKNFQMRYVAQRNRVRGI
ncbi:MAG: TRAP transporter substrate-binding protein [Pseudomonadota bacterium]